MSLKLRDIHANETIYPPRECFATTFLIEGEPIAIFCGRFILDGVMLVWSLTSDHVNQYAKSFHKRVKELIHYWFEKDQVRRMQMTVRVGYSMGWRWAKSLGFQCEGTLRKYGTDGCDYWMFSKVSP